MGGLGGVARGAVWVGWEACLAALDEALEGEALEVGVDPQGHDHDLPHETRDAIGPCLQQSIEPMTPQPEWGGWGVADLAVGGAVDALLALDLRQSR